MECPYATNEYLPILFSSVIYIIYVLLMKPKTHLMEGNIIRLCFNMKFSAILLEQVPLTFHNTLPSRQGFLMCLQLFWSFGTATTLTAMHPHHHSKISQCTI